jgi:hypothetical protein
VQEPTEEDYYQALQEGFASDSQQERSLRILAWWRRNDAFRRTSRAEVGCSAPVTGECRANLEALVSLLDEADENDRFLKAEVLRELGEFESAKLVLRRVTSGEYTAVVRQLNALCNSGDASLKELEFDD